MGINAKTYIEEEEKKIGFPLREKQRIGCEMIESGKNTLLVLPTSYGKTKPAIFAVLRTQSLGKKTIWLSPLKSLTNEQMETLGGYVKVLPVTGDFRENKKKIAGTLCDVILMTYEMLNVILTNKDNRDELIDQVGCLVVDEAHNVCEGERGAKLEGTLKLMKFFYPHIQIVYLSATIGNYEQFAKWTGSNLVYAPPSERPVPLEKRIMNYTKEMNSQANFESKQNLLRVVLAECKDKKAKMIVFCSSRQRCEDLAEIFNGFCGLKVAYHHAGLNMEERKVVENEFKKKEGGIEIIFATPTLAQGVNLPADYCNLFDITRWLYLKSQEVYISRNEMIQMVGRAGRFGISKFGLAIAFCDRSEQPVVEDMWNNPLIIDSQIPQKLELVLLHWVVGGINTYSALYDAYMDIYTEKSRLNKAIFDKVVSWLGKCGFIKFTNGEHIEPTTFGQLTTYMSVRPQTALHFLDVRNNLEEMDEVNLFQLFDMILDTEEFTDNIVVRRTKADQLAVNTGMRFLGAETDPRIAKAFAMTFNDYITEEYNLEKVKAGNADKYILHDSSARIVNAFKVIVGYKTEYRELIDKLNNAIAFGTFDDKIMKLIELPKIGVKRAVKLKKAGVDTLEKFVSEDNAKLRQIISKISNDQLDEAKLVAIEIIEGKIVDKSKEPEPLDD